jgi:hypothetical protein
MPEKSEVKTAEIVPKEELVDEKLVDEAAKHIQKTLAETVARGVMEVGGYVFQKFFDGDVGKVTSRDPAKSASFAKLAERCGTAEMPISKTWLHNALWVAVVGKELGPKSPFNQLPPSHQTALLPLRYHDDFERLEKAAEKVAEAKMPVKKVRELVEKQASKIEKSPGGRPPKKLILKKLDGSLKSFAFEDGKTGFTKADVDELSEDQVKDALAKAQMLAKSLEGLIERLKKA